MTIPELEALGYAVTAAGDAYRIEADGICIYVADDGLAALEMPDPAQVALDAAASAAKDALPAFDPVGAVAKLDPKTATAGDIINAIRGGA